METKKTNKADLERKKGIFFQIGLVTSLALVFLAFEWRSYSSVSTFDTGYRKPESIETLPPITKVKPPEPPKKAITAELVITNKAPETNTNLFNTETNQNEIIKIPEIPSAPPEAPIDEVSLIVQVPEVFPEFPGGEMARLEFMKKNIKYPQLAREIGLQGTVFVSFVVEKDGSLSNIKILKSVGGGCDEEALRVLNLMPKWTPGKQRFMPVRVQVSMPIKFVLN